ncbi:MAG: hypothetical protein MR531_17570 [Lachnospiraceae bacterium]|nr:hypothetical protein [Lachnospiraceae bacterium]
MKIRRKQTLIGKLLLAALLLLFVPKMITKASEESNSTTETEMTEVTIEEAEISMQLPTSCYLLKQNIAEDDPYLQKVGGDREKIQNYYKEAGIVLNAIAQDDSYEIAVTMNENSNISYMYNMQSLTEEEIQEFADTIQSTYVSYGYTVDGYELYETEHASYVVFRFEQLYEEQKVQCRQYYTIRDSRIYNILLRSYIGEVTQDMETMIAQVIDSIVFTESDDGITYKNEDNGVSFCLESGWKKAQSKQDEQYVQAQYVHTTELGESIQFFCMDLWGNMDSLHQLTNTREELTMQEGLTNADKKAYKAYAAGFFDDYNSTYFQKIGDTWYLTSDTPMQAKNSNSDGTYMQKSAVTVQNGILYAFQYGYYEGANLHEKDYQELLKGITYQSPKLLIEDGKYYENIAGMLYKMTAVIVFIVILVAFVMYLYHKGTEDKKL